MENGGAEGLPWKGKSSKISRSKCLVSKGPSGQ